MKQSSKRVTTMTVGLDVGDAHSIFVGLDSKGVVVQRDRVATTPKAIAAWAQGLPRCRIALEAGTHAGWMTRAITAHGHEVIVANPRRLRLISGATRKSDLADAESLARLARVDQELLSPVKPRTAATQAALSLLRARDTAVRARTALINAVRGGIKAHGARLPKCSTHSFHRKVPTAISAELRPIFEPLLNVIGQATIEIRNYDRQIEALAARDFPQTEVLQQIAGVGPLTALAFVLIVEDPARFRKSRDVAAFLGLVPKRRQSGDSDPQQRISKAGDKLVRRLLVGSAHYILGPFGPDCDLKRFGERIAARGGKAAKKRAAVAVARKLSVVMHRLWVTGEEYQPLRSVAAAA